MSQPKASASQSSMGAATAKPPQPPQSRTNALVAKKLVANAGGSALSAPPPPLPPATASAAAATSAKAGSKLAAAAADAGASIVTQQQQQQQQQRKGALMLKTVSLFLASSRRFSLQGKSARGDADAADADKRKSGAARRRRMDDSSTGKLNPRQLETLKKRTHFDQRELEGLTMIFRKLVVSSNATSRALAANSLNAVIPKTHATVDGIDSNCFCELLHSTFDIVVEEFLMERLFSAWQRDHERQPLRLEPFLCGLSVFLRGSPPERMAYCFRVYDLNGDGYLTKDEMFALLKNCLIHPPQEEDPEEAVREWLEIIMRKMDVDGDGRISFEDYCAAVAADALLLEALGQCLPTRYSVISFLSTLT